MRLGPGEYFGKTVWERRANGLRLTLSVYEPERTMPWHCHANATFIVLLAGEYRDQSSYGGFNQPAFSLVYHPSTYPHAGELGPQGMRGLNIEYEPHWLERHGLREADLGSYRPLDSAQARMAALRLLATAFQSGRPAEADLETQGLELLAPLVNGPAWPHGDPVPPWLDRVEEFLQERFREAVSLRDVAQEAGVHPVYLARIFRRRHGCSVSEYLRALRLAEAGRLVLEGACLAQAACAAGFSDQPHFSRAFAKELGLTPKALRPIRLSFPAR